ncbi:MAG: hypothetical protein MUC28_04425 [Planctomycetes bacterium]|jgi:hypothetical protein|nr:hypothetical protein [Planctomycetota bacterium]
MEKKQSYLIRGLRLADTYINLSGNHIYNLMPGETPVNARSSRFLRPYSHFLRFLEPLKIRRIKKAMTAAARAGKVFHLWWHPHNFGVNQAENLAMLKKILEHFRELKDKYGMESRNMREAAEIKNL